VIRILWPGGGSSIGGNRTSGPRYDVRELLQELGSTSLLYLGGTVDDEVFLQPGRVDLRALERQHHLRVAGNVAELLLREQVGRDEVIAVETHPDARDLRRAVGVQRDKVRQGAGFDQLAGVRGKLHGTNRTLSATCQAGSA